MAASGPFAFQHASQTKIVATLGPACRSDGILVEMIEAGVDVFRINTAHGTSEEHEQALQAVRRASGELRRPVAVLIDLAGPKIRLGELPGGAFECARGATVRFVGSEHSETPGDFTTTYPSLVDELRPGDRVMLADGTVALEVESVDSSGARCRITQGGTVRSRQGVNLPGAQLSIPSLTPADRENAVWAARSGADFISLSFVRRPEDLRELKALIAPFNPTAHVVAKIEKPEALAQLEAIVQEANAVMVARGDLGVEIDIAELPVVQRRIIDVCHRFRRPVIIATQMLDSMQHSRVPTRAEATDVATAIRDGADACMLSAETAIGRHPCETVAMMHRIALATERSLPVEYLRSPPDASCEGLHPITQSTACAAGELATLLAAKMLVVISASGRSALALSQCRLPVPTIGLSESEATLRRMCLYWGVLPATHPVGGSAEQVFRGVIGEAVAAGRLKRGDRVVMLTGTGLAVSRHNAIVVHEVE